MEYKYIQIEIKDQAGYLLFCDPKKRNAFSPQMVKEIISGLTYLRFHKEVKVIVLRGAEGNFCGGADVAAMKEKMLRIKNNIPFDEDPRLNLDRLIQIIQIIRDSEKPVVAWLEGAVAGAGMSVAMACDFSYASSDCKMLFAFVNVALVPDMGATVMLTKRVGPVKATELFMTGKCFSGKEAADWGIITESAEPDELGEKVNKCVNRLASGPSLAYEKMKKLINRAVYKELSSSMINEMECQMQLNKSKDHVQAVEAFLEKTRPVFTGE